MHYTSIELKNFRSYTDHSVEFYEGVNIVVGPNASGKTNLLESVLYISRGSSFRAQDRSLIQEGADWFRLHATTNDDHKRSVTVKKQEDETTKKEFALDGSKSQRLHQSKIIPTTLFEPEHLRMIAGAPEKRREYLDSILMQTVSGYATTMRRYKKALAQRNRLLKEGHPKTADDVFVWDVQLSEYGAIIHQERSKLAESINASASETYTHVSGNKTVVEVIYSAGGVHQDYASKLLKGLQERFKTDRERGFTTLGPHREDLQFFINTKDASTSASRGEARTLVLVCKVMEMNLLEESYDKKPIVLLDDVFSELDGLRRRALTEFLKHHQTIITTTDADAIIKSFLGDYNVIATGDSRA